MFKSHCLMMNTALHTALSSTTTGICGIACGVTCAIVCGVHCGEGWMMGKNTGSPPASAGSWRVCCCVCCFRVSGETRTKDVLRATVEAETEDE